MESFTITTDDKDVFIRIDKSVMPLEKISELTNWLKLMFIDDKHIPSVDDNEEQEITKKLDSLSDMDKEIISDEIISI